MSQVLVWKSDADGKLFEDKTKYQNHLRKLAAKRREQKKIEQGKIDREAFLIRMGNEVTGVDSLNQFIKDNWSWFFYNGVAHEWSHDKKTFKFHEYHDVHINVYGWNDNVSNSHCCPRGGVQNWCARDTDKPTGYPGWTGRIIIKVKTATYKYKGGTYMEDGFGGGYFADTPIKTGTGGGGGGDDCKEYAYDLKLFASDFPTWSDNVMKARVWEAMTNGQQVEFV